MFPLLAELPLRETLVSGSVRTGLFQAQGVVVCFKVAGLFSSMGRVLSCCIF